MKEVLERMLAVEEQAKQIVADAELRARRTVEHAQAEARRIVDEARQRALADANALQAQRVDAARQERDQRLREGTQANEKQRQVDPDRRRQAVQHVLKAVLGDGQPEAG